MLGYRGLSAAAGAAGAGALWYWSSAPRVHPLAEPQSESGDELLLVQVVFRHGARTPLGKRYWPELVDRWDVCAQAYPPVAMDVVMPDGSPRKPNPDDDRQVETALSGGCAKGELTRIGQQQARDLGAWLRARYVEGFALLPPAYAPGVLAAQTTNYSRTRATLAGVLTGLYPRAGQPIRVVTAPQMDEILYGNTHNCERLRETVKELYSTRQAYTHARPEIRVLSSKVRAALSLPPDARVNFLDLYDALYCMRTHSKPIPEALSDPALQLAVEREAVDAFLGYVAPDVSTGKQEEVLRLGMGRLLQTLVQGMDAAERGEAGPRLQLYSGHDSTILPILVACGKTVERWPPFLANLVFELWRRPGGEAYVKMRYNREELPLVELCGGTACKFADFKSKVMGPLLLDPAAYARECVVHYKHTGPAGETVETREKGVTVGASVSTDD